MRAQPIWRSLLALIPLAFVGALFAYPVSRILGISLNEAGFAEVLSDPRIRASLWFTLWQAVVSTVLCVVLAFPLTWVVARHRFPGRDLVRAVVTVPFVLPTVVVGMAFTALGVSGSLWGILAAHVFYNLAVVVRTVGSVWSKLDPRISEAARTLGASPWATFRTTTLPLLAPAIASAASIVFLFCFTSFGVVLILGGIHYRTLEVEIYQQAVTFLDLPAAGALAVLQLVGVAVIMAIYSRHQESRAVRFRMVSESEALQPITSDRRRVAVAAIIVGTLGLQLLPLAILVWRSLDGGGAGWRFLIDPGPLAIDPLAAAGSSLRVALVATAIAIVVGGIAATVLSGSSTAAGRWFDVVLMLPLGTSAVTIGLGFLVSLGSLRSSPWLIPLAHALVAVPFVVRSVLPTLRSIRRELREAARMLGASPGRVWWEIDLPIVARALAVGAGFALAISLGEFGATTFIVRPDTLTLPTMIFRLLGRPGAVTYAGALAASTVLMIVTGLLILAVDRLRSTDVGTF